MKELFRNHDGIKDKIEEGVDTGRRDFIKNGAIGFGGVTIVISVPGFLQKAVAGYPAFYQDAPSAIKMTYEIDPKAYNAYIFFKRNREINPNDYRNVMETLRIMEARQISNNNRCMQDTPTLDPGYHHIACMTWAKMIKEGNSKMRSYGGTYRGKYGATKIDTLKNNNMKNFANSLEKFYNRWEIGRTEDLEKIEKGFLNAIFISIGEPLDRVEMFMSKNTPEESRELYIQRLLPKIEKMKKGIDMRFPPQNRNPQDPFYKLLLIKEASKMLNKHYAYSYDNMKNSKSKQKIIDKKETNVKIYRNLI